MNAISSQSLVQANFSRPVPTKYPVSRWTIADALKVRTDDPTTTMPVIDYQFPIMSNDVMIWDSGALRDMHMRTVTFKGWFVLWSLAVDKIDKTNAKIYDEWHSRNDRAYIGYWYSRDGVEWTWGGRLFQTSADLRPWEWSGSLVMREGTENKVDMFYTSVGAPDGNSVPAVSSGTIHADDKGVWFDGFATSTEMFKADGVHYANASEDPYFDFRDPQPFINPGDGQLYTLFEGNVPGARGQFVIGTDEMGAVPPGYAVDAGAQYGAAAIGLARCVSGWRKGDYSRWELMPALVTALGVNDQTERPHFVFKDGLTYLFTISHHSTYTGKSTGPDGVYGFVSEKGIFGPYKPLNSSGLVLGNPSSQPYSTYSHFVDAEGYVQSFIDTIPAAGQNAENPDTYRIGGTLAPTVRLVLDGDRTFLTEVHDYAQVFAQSAWPASLAYDVRA
ncbi:MULTISPECIES: glycoside hydrolase family 68 protein [Gluconobacter]|uniref:glycoside hydrolase family 68 protein n=1 Tax=Gluconobacter TaxID=441 RepID=UPI00062C8FEC|nr:glycoside hydrolase family 68 protein [Gluconobacter oxydans]